MVDNGSADATVDLLPSRFPWVRLIASQRNLGFTGGNNAGYAASIGRFVYFLNPDTELASAADGPDSLYELYAAIAVDETVAVIGPQLRYADGLWQNSRRTFPTRLTGFVESTWFGRTWPRNPWARRLYMEDWPGGFAHDVDWLVGAAILARRSVLEQVRMPEYAGPFDEEFFMYSEEMDLCRRVKYAGWRIVYHPQAVVVHYEGRSSEQAVAARHVHFNTSKVRYYDKYLWIVLVGAVAPLLVDGVPVAALVGAGEKTCGAQAAAAKPAHRGVQAGDRQRATLTRLRYSWSQGTQSRTREKHWALNAQEAKLWPTPLVGGPP